MHVSVNDHPSRRRRRRLAIPAAAALALTLGLAACGDDDEEVTAATTTTEAEAPTTTEADGDEADGDTVEITGVDYEYQGVPETAPVGTEFSFTNASEGEFHEVILVRIDDEETRSVEELLALSEEESEELIDFKGVSVAFPLEDGMVVEGELVVDEPGRYAMVCFIPTDADPEAYREIMASPPGEGEGPPDVPGGPPHFTEGMFAELTVE